MPKSHEWVRSNCKFAADIAVDELYEMRVADQAGEMAVEYGVENAAILAEHKAREAERKKDLFSSEFWQDVKRAIEWEQNSAQNSHTLHPRVRLSVFRRPPRWYPAPYTIVSS